MVMGLQWHADLQFFGDLEGQLAGKSSKLKAHVQTYRRLD